MKMAVIVSLQLVLLGCDSPSQASRKVVNVNSIGDLKSQLLDNTVDEIVVADGTYSVSAASLNRPNSLWIDRKYASRTRPVVVRAQSKGGVIFDGGGATYYGGISFEEGAHHQTWDGFNFVNGTPTSTGVITIGGYVGDEIEARACHHITLRNIVISRCSGNAKTADVVPYDHGIYVSQAYGGPSNLVFEDILVEDSLHLGLGSAFAFHHSDPTNGILNASNVMIQRATIVGTQRAIILNDPTLRNITFLDIKINDVLRYALYYSTTGSQGIVFQNVRSTGTPGGQGFYSTQGSNPVGLTFINCDLR